MGKRGIVFTLGRAAGRTAWRGLSFSLGPSKKTISLMVLTVPRLGTSLQLLFWWPQLPFVLWKEIRQWSPLGGNSWFYLLWSEECTQTMVNMGRAWVRSAAWHKVGLLVFILSEVPLWKLQPLPRWLRSSPQPYGRGNNLNTWGTGLTSTWEFGNVSLCVVTLTWHSDVSW